MFEDDVDKLIAEQENENMKEKTMYDLSIVLKLLREARKEEREIEKIPPEELNIYLSEFTIAARMKKGEDYKPSSFKGILSGVDRYLTRREYGKKAVHWSRIYKIYKIERHTVWPPNKLFW